MMSKSKLISSIVCLFISLNCWGATITVDDDGIADYASIQDAIDNSSDTDVIVVQPGIYNELINFYGKAITVTGTNPDDINTVYATVIDATGLTGDPVTFDSGETDTSKIIGLTMQYGEDGIYCYYSDPVIEKCVVRNNTRYGIYGFNTLATIKSSVIRENGNIGIYDCDGLISECLVEDNTDNGMMDCGGTIDNNKIIGNKHGMRYCHGTITFCVIQENEFDGIHQCRAKISNCIVSGNLGDGIELWSSEPHSIISNCTIIGNKLNGISSDFNKPIENCIITLNGGFGISSAPSAILKYNNIWGNLAGNYSITTPGTTDTHENPQFLDNGSWNIDNWVEGEYFLKSEAGRWTETGWVNDIITSPCIDAGDPTTGVFFEPAPNGDRVNQGAYGGTDKASKSPWGPEPYCAEYIPGDANLDCRMDLLDIAIISSYWLDCNLEPIEACLE